MGDGRDKEERRERRKKDFHVSIWNTCIVRAHMGIAVHVRTGIKRKNRENRKKRAHTCVCVCVPLVYGTAVYREKCISCSVFMNAWKEEREREERKRLSLITEMK